MLGGGLLLLTVTAPKVALLLVFLASQYLLIGWPVTTAVACMMAVATVRAGPMAVRWTWTRLAWACLLGLVATYGYGFTRLEAGTPFVEGQDCRGGQSLLPLSNTACGADTVPGFVNPLLAILAGLLAVCAAGYISARLRAR